MQLSLANKYRPQSFDSMIWQHHIVWILKAKMQSERDWLQNYLLTWPRWTGKTTSARILAKAINCLTPNDGNPCNTCANCTAISQSSTLDYVEIDAASHTWVDNIREEVLDKALYPPTMLKKKIYVIDEVHMLSKWAFNSLLKTIEEPKWNVCFILATTEIQKVPDTIISRCQTFQFKKVSENEIADHLSEICKSEWFDYDPEALKLIAMISDWWVRDSIKYLDQVSILGKITLDNVSQFLWVLSDASIKDFLTKIKNRDKNLTFISIDTLNQQGIDLAQFAKQIIGFIDRHLMEDMDFYLQVSSSFSEILRQIRYYPYPTVLFKMELDKFLDSSTTVLSPTQHQTQASTTIPASTSQPTPAQQPKSSYTPWEALITSFPDGTLKNFLSQDTILDSIDNWTAKLIITNKMAEIAIQRPDNKSEIQKKLSEITGEPITLELSFESKESYLARNLSF